MVAEEWAKGLLQLLTLRRINVNNNNRDSLANDIQCVKESVEWHIILLPCYFHQRAHSTEETPTMIGAMLVERCVMAFGEEGSMQSCCQRDVVISWKMYYFHQEAHMTKRLNNRSNAYLLRWIGTTEIVREWCWYVKDLIHAVPKTHLFNPAPSQKNASCTQLLRQTGTTEIIVKGKISICKRITTCSTKDSPQKAHSTVETCAIAVSSTTKEHATRHIAREEGNWGIAKENALLPTNHTWRDSDDKSHEDGTCVNHSIET